MRKTLTLCIVHQNNRVLLGLKKRGFGAGRFNGFGGKVESDETIEEAAQRELTEEAQITAQDLQKLGMLTFIFENNVDILNVHIFKVENFEGEIGESEEMTPQWFPLHEVPFAHMWKDDQFWFPYFLENRKFIGCFAFDSQDEILDYKLREAPELF